MKNKVIKLIGAFMIVVSLVTMMPIESVEAAYNKYSTYTYTTGWGPWKHKYDCTVYKDSISYYTIFYGTGKVSTGFDYKPNKKNNIVISQTTSFSISSQTKNTLNVGVDFSDYGVPVNVGGSVDKTKANTWGVSSTITRTVDKSDPVGYYSYNVLLNTMKLKIEKKENGKNKGTIKFSAPSSEAYRSIVYSKTGNYTDATKYY
ncbi:MAG: hypothetical protein HFJ09_08445 [Lachnospiraceae bacterium]|nr:hypothetical protein [Lachnospiraceae bacterium]